MLNKLAGSLPANLRILEAAARFECLTIRKNEIRTMPPRGSGSVSLQMSDKLKFVAAYDKLKHIGYQTDPLLAAALTFILYP